MKEKFSQELSSERYRELVEHSGDMISTHRPGDWAYTSVNPAVERISGYRPEDLLGRPAYDFFHPDDARAMCERTIPAIRRFGLRTFRYRHLNPDGRYTWVESTHRSVRDPISGELREIIAVTRDISAQLDAERLSRRLASVVASSSDMVVFCDAELRVNYMNEAAQAAFQLRAVSANLSLALLLDVGSFAEICREAVGVAQREGVWRGSLRLGSPEFAGRTMALQEVQAHRDAPAERLNDGDDGLCFSLIIRDLTAQLRAEQEALHFQNEMAHVSRLMALGEMATTLAHEINQPLATSLNYARGALRQIEEGRVSHATELTQPLQSIARQAERAAAIVKRLRSLARKAPYRLEVLDLVEVCRDVAGFMAYQLEREGVSLDCDYAEARLPINADRVQMEQVLINLLQNAIEAYRETTVDEKKLALKVWGEAGKVCLSLTDWAGGVAPELRESLLEPYVSSKPDGVGMGLAIVRGIVEAHSGVLRIDSDGSSYSCFYLEFAAVDAAAISQNT